MSELVAGAYPLQLNAARPLSSSRFWAIPLIGIAVKGIILIPHFVVLWLIGIVVGVSHLVIWIPVLFTGTYPDWGWGLNAGYLHWWMRVTLYLYGVTDSYPPFSMSPGTGVTIQRPPSSSRFFAIPIVGVVVKYVILIPHFIVLYVLGLVVAACQLAIWIPVLFTGAYPEWAFGMVSGTQLWTIRVYAYLLGLTDRYPPFGFN
jgi:hypothetical protein